MGNCSCHGSREGICTTICLVRHGETPWNIEGRLQGQEDVEMNETGRLQAKAIADYLKREKWDIVVSSPLQRAKESAQIISDELGLGRVNIVSDLKERSYGSAAGMLPDERRLKFPDGIPDQEAFDDLRERAFDAINSIAEFYYGDKVIVVSHGGLINSILYTISDGEFGSYKTRLQNGCINMLKFDDGDWSVEFYNKLPDDLKK